ncbi:M48 family metalloprotease [Gammaproteobacteria bacterium AB-CW1]|uniref:M48 family metalloprotease n=1 Tax=Natronospira elongata TaxID=3110268 RepID=A0AAP6MKI3_9GAMM|nr:M48 family metalloprotease [Gammaproteobacteria bacterium AB-CW1]
MRLIVAKLCSLVLAAALNLSPAPAHGQAFDISKLPDLGDASSTVFSPREQDQIGKEVVRRMREASVLLEDPDIEEYVRDLGQHIAAHSSRPGDQFHFFVMRSAEINAFALPGGYIGLNAGLILAADTEAELAGVVAHEIAHVTQRHIARQIDAMQGSGLATLGAMLGAILIAANTGDSDAAMATMLSAQALQLQRQINYTRAHEYEADRVGIQMMADAGFDPEGMARFFEKLQRRHQYGAGQAVPEYLRTHPLTTHRITEARNRARRLSEGEYESGRRFYLARERINARVAVSSGRDPVQLTPARSPASPSFTMDLQRYRQALEDQFRGRHEQAARVFDQLRQSSPDIIAYHVGHAENLLGQGKMDEALALLQRAAELFPDNEVLMESHARTLLQMDKPEEALALLQRLTRRPGAQPRHFRMMAEASNNLGDIPGSHFHMAGYFHKHGDLYHALTQMRMALSHPALDDSRRNRYMDRMDQLHMEWRNLPSSAQRAQRGTPPR